jgi:sugar phosphate isomerase/epimerase
MQRREVLQAFSAGIALAGFPALAPGRFRALSSIGLQLYTVRSEMQRSVERTLERVAAIGYGEVEFAGYFERSAQHIRSLLDDNGLIDAADRQTLDQYKRMADRFNRVGERAREVGMTFGYHNHDFEFASLEGRIPFDVILQHTDPHLVGFEMDLFWITKGGRNPMTYFRDHPGRFPMVHVKDMGIDGAMVDVGTGRIDFAAIFAHGEQAGIEHYFVEHDNPSDPFRSVTTSYEYLRTLEF